MIPNGTWRYGPYLCERRWLEHQDEHVGHGEAHGDLAQGSAARSQEGARGRGEVAD
jgi:hypothetical protein